MLIMIDGIRLKHYNSTSITNTQGYVLKPWELQKLRQLLEQ